MRSPDLYQAILARRSVRRYERTPLDEATLDRVRAIIAGVHPLVPAQRYQVLLRTTAPGEDLVAALGGYGRIVNPPHYLVPFLVGDEHPLEDLGYRAEQIAVRLTQMGLGSCYLACLGRQRAVRARFGLPERARIGALLIFGWASGALAGRAVNRLLRAAVRATRRLPVERIFFRETFDNPGPPPEDLAPLIEAARHAPSAVNTQPWRFLWHQGELHLFVRRRNLQYGTRAGAALRLYDGGICMANVSLALEALGMQGRWLLYEGSEPTIPPHPAALQPLAHLELT